MSFADFASAPQVVVFTIALAVVVGFLALEIIGLMLGYSTMGDGDADIDVDFDTDVDFDLDVDIDADLDVAFGDHHDIDVDIPSGSLWSFLEFGKVPLLAWIVSMCGAYAMSGYVGQLIFKDLTGLFLPSIIAYPAAVVPTLLIGRFFVRGFAIMVPKTTTQAVSRSSLAGSTGVISVGTADAGNPAEARVSDKHGNTHSIRVVPFKGESALPQGTDIVVLRGTEPGVFQALELSIAKKRYNSSLN